MNMYHLGIDRSHKAIITFTDYRGENKRFEISGDKFGSRGDLLGPVMDQLVVADGFQIVTCEIYNANNELVSTTRESVESYVARAMADASADPVFENLLKFAYSSRKYFTK